MRVQRRECIHCLLPMFANLLRCRIYPWQVEAQRSAQIVLQIVNEEFRCELFLSVIYTLVWSWPIIPSLSGMLASWVSLLVELNGYLGSKVRKQERGERSLENRLKRNQLLWKESVSQAGLSFQFRGSLPVPPTPPLMQNTKHLSKPASSHWYSTLGLPEAVYFIVYVLRHTALT